ncbi:hypothetical protein Tco_0085223, partial [Tanacetum coccineum]
MHQVQVNTKFLNALPSEWSKFVTDVKFTKSLYTTNYDQLYAYLSQHERHANEVRIMRERYPDPLALQGEDPIDYINKAMAFLSVVTSRFPSSNNQLRTSSNPRNQATIQDKLIGRAHGETVYSTKEAKKFCVVQREVDKSAFQTEDLDAYDSDYDDISSAKAVLMENLSSCDSDVLSEVPYSDAYPNDMTNQDVQEMSYSEQTHIDTNSSAPNDLLVLSLVEQMTDHVANLDKENQTNKMVNDSLTAELERYKERVAIFEQRINADSNNREKLIDSQMDDLMRKRNAKFTAFQQEIDTLKETLSNNVKENESLSKTLTVFKTESKEKESKYIDNEIVLENQNKELENIILKMYRYTQAMYMLTKPQVFYDDTHKQALGYQNPFHLKKA